MWRAGVGVWLRSFRLLSIPVGYCLLLRLNDGQEETPRGQDQSLVNPETSNASLTVGDQLVSSMARDCLLRLGTLCFYEDDKEEITEGAEKKKRVARIVGRGLRQFSVIVYKKVEAKRRTTYSEVADEIIAEFSADGENDNITQYDEKNIRRRVYDAFNVLLAIGVIARDRKEIRWVGFPNIRRDLEEIVQERVNLLNRIQEKVQYLQELEEHDTLLNA
ncbi:hypothetical protein Taro_005372 [Colocasia esculenta]|uniref:E2F/DP family winged-helix DNA-binding domain-containing protein n=1 Tax=Colocasia esculenta TaxID=4460 RepID=A0A843TXM5_COLES|nr:hypothetical protein [Colocasia esculenta]